MKDIKSYVVTPELFTSLIIIILLLLSLSSASKIKSMTKHYNTENETIINIFLCCTIFLAYLSDNYLLLRNYFIDYSVNSRNCWFYYLTGDYWLLCCKSKGNSYKKYFRFRYVDARILQFVMNNLLRPRKRTRTTYSKLFLIHHTVHCAYVRSQTVYPKVSKSILGFNKRI